jgi:HK97 family phage major capsid protein
MAEGKTKKNQWVKLDKDWNGHKEGEKLKVSVAVSEQLVKELTARECKSPTQKLVAKAAEVIGGRIHDEVAKSTQEAIKILMENSEKERAKGVTFPWQSSSDPKKAGESLRLWNDAGNVPGVIGRGFDGDLVLSDNARYSPFSGSGVGMGKWLCDVKEGGDEPSKEYCKGMEEKWKSRFTGGMEKAALAESSGVTGGYTVPVEFLMRLMQLVIQQSVIRPRAQVFPMASRELRIPTLDVTTPQSAGVTAFLGGLKAFWAEEASSRPETEPQFKQVSLIAHELTGYTLASNTILQDNAVALDALLTRLFTQAISWFSDYAFLQGNGAGKPVGILNAPASIVQNRTTTGKFLLADAANMYADLLTTSMGSAVWLMSQTLIPQLVQLADAANRVVWLPNAQSPGGGAAQTMPATLFGLPIIFTEKLPALGTKGDVMLVDPSYYMVGDRMQIEIASSIHFRFQNNQTAWRFLARLDGKPWLDKYVTLADAATIVSPFVVLNT